MAYLQRLDLYFNSYDDWRVEVWKTEWIHENRSSHKPERYLLSIPFPDNSHFYGYVTTTGQQEDDGPIEKGLALEGDSRIWANTNAM